MRLRTNITLSRGYLFQCVRHPAAFFMFQLSHQRPSSKLGGQLVSFSCCDPELRVPLF